MRDDQLTLGDVRDGADELRQLRVLREEAVEPQPDGLLEGTLVVEGRDDHDLGVRPLLEDLSPELESAATRQADIEEDHVG